MFSNILDCYIKIRKILIHQNNFKDVSVSGSTNSYFAWRCFLNLSSNLMDNLSPGEKKDNEGNNLVDLNEAA